MKIAGVDNSQNSPALTIFELDENLDIINYDYINLHKTKKLHIENHIYPMMQYDNECQRIVDKNEFIVNELIKRSVEYVAIEDYSFASIGKNFSIGENTGVLKCELYKAGVKIRLYDVTTNKMAFCGFGNGKKIDMIKTYINKYNNPLQLPSKILEICDVLDNDSKKILTPLEDIVDSFALTNLLHIELKLRRGLINLKDLPEKVIQCFNKVRKDTGTNLLDSEFIFRKNNNG